MQRYCASCRAGEIEREADYYVQGWRDYGYRRVPYRAYICRDHYMMMEDDGADLRVMIKVSEWARKRRTDK